MNRANSNTNQHLDTLLGRETFARRRMAKEFTLMRAAGRTPYGHHVPVGDDVLHMELWVGEGCP